MKATKTTDEFVCSEKSWWWAWIGLLILWIIYYANNYMEVCTHLSISCFHTSGTQKCWMDTAPVLWSTGSGKNDSYTQSSDSKKNLISYLSIRILWFENAVFLCEITEAWIFPPVIKDESAFPRSISHCSLSVQGFAKPSLPLLPECDLVLRCAMWALRSNLLTYHLQIKLQLNIRSIKGFFARIINWRDFYSILTRHKYKNRIKQKL